MLIFSIFFLSIYFVRKQHTEGAPYMSDVMPPPFTTAIWNHQEQPPPMVSYPELMGFPCSDLGNCLCKIQKCIHDLKIVRMESNFFLQMTSFSFPSGNRIFALNLQILIVLENFPSIFYSKKMIIPIPALWPRSQIGGLVSQRLSPRGALTAPNSNGNASVSTKKTRRRVASMAQRRAANIRERRRMFNLNEAFDKLRRKVSFELHFLCLLFVHHQLNHGIYIPFFGVWKQLLEEMKPIQAKATLLREIKGRSDQKLNKISYISVMSDHSITWMTKQTNQIADCWSISA